MPSLDEKFQEAIRNICANHHKIIDDWCKAYLAELYGLGIDIRPGCFTLNQMQVNEEGKAGWKYWFTIKGKTMEEHNFIETTIKEMFDSACKIIINEKLDDAEFELCQNTIQTTLTYLKAKRRKEKEDQ